MAKFIASDVVRGSRGLKHAPGHYALGVAKHVARRASASSQGRRLSDDVREFVSFLPVSVNARVVAWPKLSSK